MKTANEKQNGDIMDWADIARWIVMWGMLLASICLVTLAMLPPVAVETIGNCTGSIHVCHGYNDFDVRDPFHCTYCDMKYDCPPPLTLNPFPYRHIEGSVRWTCDTGTIGDERSIKLYLVYVGSDVVDVYQHLKDEFDPNTSFKLEVWIVVGSILNFLFFLFLFLLFFLRAKCSNPS